MTDFLPSATWSALQRRAELLRGLRELFYERGFCEVETPLISADTVVDRHLDPVPIQDLFDSGTPVCHWLQTSPEFGMKRLLAAGAEAIFQVTRAFRRNEFGAHHNPEFTMVEWYRVGDDLRAGMELLAQLAEPLLRRGPVDRCSYREAFAQRIDLDPHVAPVPSLQAAARKLRLVIPDGLADDDRDAWLHLLMAEVIQPNLGLERPLILYDYPASQAALARLRNDDPPVAERFELFCQGVELANGYHELLDADVLMARQRRENAWRQRDGLAPLPESNRLVTAMRAGLPACTGVALGFDRLVMIALGARTLAEVMAFPFPRA